MSDEPRRDEEQNSAREWGEIFRDMGDQIRRDAARTVGASEDADWETIGRRTDEKARQAAARTVGADEDADWETIGQRLERSTRAQIAQIFGQSPDADWRTIGQTIGSRMETLFRDVFEVKREEESTPETGESQTEDDDLVDPWQKE